MSYDEDAWQITFNNFTGSNHYSLPATNFSTFAKKYAECLEVQSLV